MHSYRKSKLRVSAISAAVAAALGLVAGNAVAISQSGEAKNMIRVGHTDLQGRPTYQPNVINYPDGRTILFVGQHSGNPRPVPGYTFLPNPLNHNADENNGTMIIDVTDPRNPVEKALIPAPVDGKSVGQSQMARMCLGSQLPGGAPGKVYLLRNSQSGDLAISGYQIWDVTDVEHPVKTSEQMGLRSTHKVWWECSTGIIYAPGSLSTPPLWKESQAMLVYDWHDVNNPPHFIRMFGLPGGEPGGTVTTSLHGAISAHDHPMAAQKLARADDVIGNRIYAAWGVGDDGVITIIDRKKLLPAAYGGTWVPATANSATQPLETELIGPNSPTVGYFTMSPDQGGHTSMPVFGMKPPSYGKYNEFQTRDVVVVTSEATADGKDGRCNEAPHWAFTLDVTVENSMSVPPGTKVEHDPYQGPMVLGTMSVDPRSGEQSKRGNFCERGARFGVHSVEENFNNPYYGKLTAIAYFNGGIRIWDIREPQAPREVAFYVPEADALTDPDGYMTNNVEIDNRGYIYVVDRNGAGMDILELNGCAKQIADKGQTCPDLGNNNAAR